ncbi:hypothetical protein [Clostridium kluyveri]|uniref:Uncharacterized protein n=1 Tax=Clostridium kluyveri TaxID=1534 RepID=A0A1L5FAA5_CLOKL|nr:hypothetical protein [Clostridium kluyveri]APM39946.1 hypothetical protein BS101_15005 [Clostridium kluyveri]
MNENCFAYKNSRCKILKSTQCVNNSCSFFKTEEEQEESLNKAYARIASLDKAIQKSIADTYYNGKVPWLKGGDK